jgi:HlyD family secretion protein
MATSLDAAVGHPSPRLRSQTVYVLREGGRIEPVSIRTGISDGRYTAVLEGDLKPSDRVVTGLATSRVQETGQPFGSRRWW